MIEEDWSTSSGLYFFAPKATVGVTDDFFWRNGNWCISSSSWSWFIVAYFSSVLRRDSEKTCSNYYIIEASEPLSKLAMLVSIIRSFSGELFRFSSMLIWLIFSFSISLKTEGTPCRISLEWMGFDSIIGYLFLGSQMSCSIWLCVINKHSVSYLYSLFTGSCLRYLKSNFWMRCSILQVYWMS